MKCKYCGKQLDLDSVYCTECGKRITDNTNYNIGSSIDTGNIMPGKVTDPGKNRMIKRRIILLTAFWILLLFLSLAVFKLQGSNQKLNSENHESLFSYYFDSLFNRKSESQKKDYKALAEAVIIPEVYNKWALYTLKTGNTDLEYSITVTSVKNNYNSVTVHGHYEIYIIVSGIAQHTIREGDYSFTVDSNGNTEIDYC